MCSLRKRIFEAYNDFAYGFYPIRLEHSFKNRLHYLGVIMQSQEQFDSFMVEVINWTPAKFGAVERLELMTRLGVVMSDEQRALYNQLVAIDIERWFASGWEHHQALVSSSFIEIFREVIKQDPKYDAALADLERWSRRLRPEEIEALDPTACHRAIEGALLPVSQVVETNLQAVPIPPEVPMANEQPEVELLVERRDPTPDEEQANDQPEIEFPSGIGTKKLVAIVLPSRVMVDLKATALIPMASSWRVPASAVI